jgi:hypothetical protein
MIKVEGIQTNSRCWTAEGPAAEVVEAVRQRGAQMGYEKRKVAAIADIMAAATRAAKEGKGPADIQVMLKHDPGYAGDTWVVWQAARLYGRVLVGPGGRRTATTATGAVLTGLDAAIHTEPRSVYFTAPEWWAVLTEEPS